MSLTVPTSALSGGAEPRRFADESLLRFADLERFKLLPFSRATMWRLITAGAFPAPIKVSDNVSAWRWRDLRLWLEDPAGYGDCIAGKIGVPV